MNTLTQHFTRWWPAWLGVACVLLLGLFLTTLFGLLREKNQAREWATELAVSDANPRYVLVDTRMFNGHEWKTYKDTQWNTYHLLSPTGQWIAVTKP